MHGVIAMVTIEPGHAEEAQAALKTNVVPRLREQAGVVGGYSLRSADGEHGLTVLVFDSEDAARAAAESFPNLPRPEFVTVDSVEVREVVAQI